jgi:sugar lactone lactonase YvrE
VDGSGNFYIADTQNNRVLKEDLADWPSLTFNSTAVGGTSTDSPRTAQVENAGNATLLLNALTYPTDFPEADDDSNPCTNLTSLRPGGLCHLHIDFKPLSVGSPLSEDVTITDNALNETGAQQSVAVSGTALDMATHLSVTAPPNAAAEKAFAITVAALNASGGVAPGFSGTVNFSSTDPIAVLPGASTLKPGVGTFLVTLNTPGEQTITVTDRANSFTAITGTINVSAAPPGVFPARSSVNFGLQAIGSTSGAQMLSFFIGAGTTVGSVEVLTQGSPNLDFASAAGTTCKTQQYSSGTNCAVDVVFTPKGTGTRYGAVVFLDGSGNVLATVYLQGRGSGPQIQFVPGTQSAFPNPASEYQPEGVAVDGSGSVYIADAANDTVYKETLTEGSFTLSVVARFVADGLTAPLLAVALDGAGNLYIVDSNDAQVLKATPSAGGYTLSVIANSANNGLSYPGGVAVDGSGNVYIDDVSGTRVLKETLSEGGYTQSVIADNATNGLIDPYGVAVDANGNVYIADSYNKRVLKETLSEGRYTQSVVADNATNGLIDPQGIAVDGSGNVYICDGQVFKETPSGGGYSQSVIASVASNGLDYPLGVAVDGNGNVYIADFYSFRVLKEDLADPPSLTFPDTAVGTSTSYSPRRVTLNNEGNAALIFALPGSGDNPSVSAGFEWDSSSTCMQTTTSSVAAYELVGGAHCSMAFDFAPTMSGNFFGFAKLVDNNLNVNGAVQSIQLTGTGFQRSQTITFPQPASPVYYGVAPIVLSATGGASGNPVIFSMISGPGSLSGTNDSVLTVTGVGTVVIAANQAGDTDYTAAPQVTRSITVLLSKHAALTAPAP